MIKGEVFGGRAASDRIENRQQKLRTGLTTTITRLTMLLLRKVKAEKLSGQVLNSRTGRLRRSINQRVTGQDTSVVTGTVGTNVVYARPHEYGFQGKIAVRESLRMQVKAWGKSIDPQEVTVRAHMRNVNLPEKSFLRSSLAEMDPQINADLRGAVVEAIR